MNWYKRQLKRESSNDPMFSHQKFLQRLNNYGAIIESEGDGSRKTLLNLNNGKRSKFHTHEREDIGIGVVKRVLRELDIDYSEFIKFKKPIQKVVQEEDQNKKPEIPDWQKQPWFQQQMEYADNVENKY